jgi:hypothetical protein
MMSIAEALGLRIEMREQTSVEQMLAAGCCPHGDNAPREGPWRPRHR